MFEAVDETVAYERVVEGEVLGHPSEVVRRHGLARRGRQCDRLPLRSNPPVRLAG